jgi:D-3-phosphoglycerate dehydrogenase
MGALSNLMGEYGLNIVSQQLQTRGKIGYAITDVDGEATDQVIEGLRRHPITIRCDRV